MKERTAYATATYFTLFDVGIAAGSYLFGLLVIKMKFAVIYSISGLIIFILLVVYIMFSKGEAIQLKSL